MDNIRVVGLTRLDALDLKKRFPDATIGFDEMPSADPHHGELATAAIVAITSAGIAALAAWLLKDRKKSRIEQTIEVVNADGSRRTEKVLIDVNESTSEADVVRALAAVLNFDMTRAK